MQTYNQKSLDKSSFMASSSSLMEVCIQNCLDCYQSCTQLAAHCIRKGGTMAEPFHIAVLNDCAGACQASADFLIRRSEYYYAMCEICAEICTACAADCESMADDDLARKCADFCKKAAGSCIEMARHH